MRATLFVDVDGVLTLEPANMQLARRLGVENELADLETGFAEGVVATDEFGEALVQLFRRQKLTRALAEELFSSIRLRVGAERLLRHPGAYLVSSGPSYFVEPLAKKYGIDRSRVLCTRYEFEDGQDGLIKACTNPVGQVDKEEFVHDNVRKGVLSIGIGDSPEVDSQFLSHCDVKVLIREFRNGYICVKDLKALTSLIDAFESLPTRQTSVLSPDGKARVFIGSSGEGKEWARAVQVELEDQGGGTIEATVWPQNDGSIGKTVIDNLLDATVNFDYAVLVLSPDDLTQSRHGHYSVPRDNVVFECGLFIGALGKDRVFLVTASGDDTVKIPSDLGGVIYKPIPSREDGNVRAAVSGSCMDIVAAIKQRRA
jgi:predicted nucleotide-binding protein/phosphoserine phosphatase